MVDNQLETLKKYSRKLGHYVYKLNKKGKSEASYKMMKKQSFLDASIEQVNRG
jgi:hypothetical protein